MKKEFEDLPQSISYIAWNLKRIAEEFERYNDREDERWRKENPPQCAEASKLRTFLDNLKKDEL